MAITRNWAGTYVTGTSASLTPTAGGTFSVGDALIVFTGEYAGANTISTPGGWTQLDANSAVHQIRCFGLISATGAESFPTFTWGSGSVAWAVGLCYSGVDSSFTGGSTPSDRPGNTQRDIAMVAVSKTPSVDGCLCLYYGQRDKSSTSNGNTYTAPTHFAVASQNCPNGVAANVVIGEWIQTTATTIAANILFTGSSTLEPSALNNQTGAIILQPAAVSPNALLSWPKQTFVTETIIQI